MGTTQKIFSIILTSAIMFGLSYFWHMYALNDIDRPSFDMTYYYIFAPILHVCITLFIALVISLDLMNFLFSNKILGSFFAGAFIGVVIYLIQLIFGISFNKDTTIAYITIDLLWQIIHKGTGGVILKLLYRRADRLNY